MRFFHPCVSLVPFSIVSIISLAVFFPFTVDAIAQERCKKDKDKDEALIEAISYHRQLGLEGADEKELLGDARVRANWCPRGKDDRECTAYFTEKAQQYIGSFQRSALILYARDSDNICAFLFKPGQPMQYARRAVTEIAFNEDIDKLRAAYTGSLGRSVGAARRERLIALLLPDGRCKLQASQPESSPGENVALATPLTWEDTVIEKQVSDLLFPSEFYEALNGVEHLSIIPFGPITTLPVGTLRPLGDDRQTVDLFTVNYLLFAGEVARESVTWAPPTEPLIFGNPMPLDPERARCIPALPEAEKEASNAHDYFGGTYLRRGLATKQAFEEKAANADMIYFAAHGLAGLEDGISDSFIALADKNLTARDIQIISKFEFNKTHLVVMSACQTGLGRIREFGVIGLARTFLDAGAQNTVMSLWNVSDNATFLLMSKFNSQLRQWPPAEALQIAQNYLRKETIYDAPVFWAGFAVYGNQMLRSGNTENK
jgi:CHAT domain